MVDSLNGKGCATPEKCLLRSCPSHCYRQTDTCSPEKDVDPHDIIPNQESQSQTGSFNSQLDVHDNHGKYKQHSQTSLTAQPEANKRRPVDDKPQ